MKKEDNQKIFNLEVAHRGIIGKDSPENSISAFSKAVEIGLPIELDVHLTKDNQLAVFHDYSLIRMCQKVKIIEQANYKNLKEYSLKNTLQTIPQLKDVLSLIDGKTPVFIEIKTLFNNKKLCDRLIEELKKYNGEVVIFGFNYKAVKYIKNRTNYKVMVSCFRPKFSFCGFVPDAICCHLRALKNYPKERIILPIVSWTICNEKQESFAKSLGGYLKNFYI